ncbi:FAD-dependent thymidylate synthase [Candidatus Pacearchaeota archaeon]|nr:FAD-dependent thymidylate synthase [Candidatus Pacearchaeota archaeon]
MGEEEQNETYLTKRPTVEAAEAILFKPFKCLDHGFVRLMDYMGNDAAIVQAARVSYGKGTKSVSDDRGLIRYLLRHEHNTPLEMVELKFHAKMPIFVARQWVRHRTASINEISGRYSILDKEFYVPEPQVIAAQSTSNKQGRGEVVTPEEAERVRSLITRESDRAYETYQDLLNERGAEGMPKLARELARMNLTLNSYTQWYWKTDLHNLMHFLKLRTDKHAQYEIRVFADVMAEMTKAVAPMAYEAFEDFVVIGNTLKLSRLEKKALGLILGGKSAEEAALAIFPAKKEPLSGEGKEFLAKMKGLV